MKSWRKAAEQGLPAAQNNLGLMYDTGRGVPKHSKEAVKWYRKSARQGYAIAQYNLAQKYKYGEGGLEKSNLYAYAWFNIAVIGYAAAKKEKDILAKAMTAEQITKAQELSRELLK